MEFKRTVNKALGRAYGFSGIPGNQIPYFIGFFVLLSPLIIVFSFFGYLITALILYLVWLAISGDDPARAKMKLFARPKKWRSQRVECLPEDCVASPELPKLKYFIKHGQRIYWVTSFYETYKTKLEYCIDGMIASAYLHRRGKKAMVIFAWRCAGDDPLATKAMIQRKLYGRFNGLKSIPQDVDIKVVNGSFVGDDGYIQQLMDLSERPLTNIERLIIGSKIGRVRDMTSDAGRKQAGVMQSDFLYVYAKYRVNFVGGITKEPTRLEKFILSLVEAFTFGMKPPNIEDWNRVTKLAWDNCFMPMHDILTSPTNFDFDATPVTVQELWEEDYFSQRDRRDFLAQEEGQYGILRTAPPVPQYVPITHEGLGEVVYNDSQHILGSLYSSDYVPVTPQASRSYIYAPALGPYGKYVGYLKIGMSRKVESFPPINGNDDLGSYLFIYKAFRDAGNPFYDYKIYWEWSEIDPSLPTTNTERRLAGAVRMKEEAITKRKTVDVKAESDFEQSYEARQMLDQGDRPGWLALVVAVYRNTVDDLSVALDELKRKFPSANPSIADEACDDLWIQTAPYCWEMMLTKPEMICQQYFASESFRLMPCVSAPRLDNIGIMLLHQLFRSPVYLDIVHKKPNHTAIVAETGEGKSILLLEFIFQFLCYSLPGIVFEFPRSDGRSTYTDLMEILRECGKKVVYLDIKKESYNFLERPNLTHLNLNDPAQKLRAKEALQDIEKQQIELLSTLINGAHPGSDEEDINNWIVNLFYAWSEQPDVIEDYAVACSAKYGDENYNRMPNLPRLVDFAIPWLKGKLASDTTIYEGSRKAIDKICRNLESLLKTSLGRCLSGPSTFDITSDFIVLCLTDVTSDLESLVYALVGLQIITQKSATTQSSVAIVEEATTLLKRPTFRRRIEAIPVVGRKQGMNIVFAFQLLGDVSEDLFGNIQNIIVGGTTETTVNQLVRLVDFDKEIASLCVEKKKNVQKLETYFILKRGTKYIPLTHVPSKLFLSLGATDTAEVDARHRARAKYRNPADPTDLNWLIKFSDLYVEAIQSGRSMNTICQEELICA